MIKNTQALYAKIILFIFISATLFIPNMNILAEEPEAEDVAPKPDVEYKAQDLRDPFESVIREVMQVPLSVTQSPEDKQKKQLPSLSVQGLMWGGKFPQAIINNKVLKAGDTIEGARIIGIDKDGVIIFFEGDQYKLSPSAQANTSSLKTED